MVVPWTVSYDKPRECIKKQRQQFNTSQRYMKDHILKAMIFPIVMDGCESWTIGKFESRRIDAFECWF